MPAYDFVYATLYVDVCIDSARVCVIVFDAARYVPLCSSLHLCMHGHIYVCIVAFYLCVTQIPTFQHWNCFIRLIEHWNVCWPQQVCRTRGAEKVAPQVLLRRKSIMSSDL